MVGIKTPQQIALYLSGRISSHPGNFPSLSTGILVYPEPSFLTTSRMEIFPQAMLEVMVLAWLIAHGSANVRDVRRSFFLR